MSEIKIIDPFIIGNGSNFPVVAGNIFDLDNKLYYVSLRVRSMGTATYIAHGTQNSLHNRLIVKDEVYEYEAPPGKYLNGHNIKIVADQNDAVVELSGVYFE